MIRPLPARLCFKPAHKTRIVGAPAEVEPALAFARAAEGEPATWLIGFARDAAELADLARDLAPAYPRGGCLWLCYPKLSGAIRSDLTRDSGWAPIDALGLIGVAQVAIDADWSALRFRWRDEVKRITRRAG